MNNQSLHHETKVSLPLLFRIARAAFDLLDGVKGEYFIYSILRRSGYLDKKIGRFKYFGGVINLPLLMPETLSEGDFSLFHGLREINYASILNEFEEDFTLIDCGAYFGQVSMRLSKLCPKLQRIVAVEANPDNHEVLEMNLNLTGTDHTVVKCAISDSSGFARMVFPRGARDADSGYIEEADDGPIQIKSLDDIVVDLELPVAGVNVALKIDVEGEELTLVRGAKELIASASKVALFVELHPEVLRRKNLTAELLLSEISEIRPMKWCLADKPYFKISSDSPVYDQIGRERVCDVIGVSV